MSRRLFLIAAIAACGGEPRQPAADSGAPDSTEPDIITDADTLGPQPVEPGFRLVGNEPFWNLTIDPTGLRFRTPEDTAGLRFTNNEKANELLHIQYRDGWTL